MPWTLIDGAATALPFADRLAAAPIEQTYRTSISGALLYAESLVGVLGQGEPPLCEQTTRLLRVRADDFSEICTDPRLAAELYRRLAMHLARLGVGRIRS